MAILEDPIKGVLELQNYIDGEWVDSEGGTKDVVNPANMETIARVPISTGEEFDAAVDAAVEAFLHAIEIAPRNVAAYSNLGGVLRLQGRLSQATQAYRTAIELAPTNPVLYSNLAIVLREQGEIEASDEARVAWDRTASR